jgi:hypothetical protein
LPSGPESERPSLPIRSGHQFRRHAAVRREVLLGNPKDEGDVGRNDTPVMVQRRPLGPCVRRAGSGGEPIHNQSSMHDLIGRIACARVVAVHFLAVQTPCCSKHQLSSIAPLATDTRHTLQRGARKDVRPRARGPPRPVATIRDLAAALAPPSCQEQPRARAHVRAPKSPMSPKRSRLACGLPKAC